jgi:hypothetical protein
MDYSLLLGVKKWSTSINTVNVLNALSKHMRQDSKGGMEESISGADERKLDNPSIGGVKKSLEGVVLSPKPVLTKSVSLSSTVASVVSTSTSSPPLESKRSSTMLSPHPPSPRSPTMNEDVSITSKVSALDCRTLHFRFASLVNYLSLSLSPPFSSFRSFDGGLESEARDEVYYIGIIDILQEYNTKKKMETSFKSITVAKDALSSVDPEHYKSRFDNFILTNVVD